MARKVLIRKTALWGLCALAFSGYIVTVAHLLRYVDKSVVQVETTVLVPAPGHAQITESQFGIPVRLAVPKIGVDAVVASVGIAADGSMDVKKNPDETAWYNLGARPGDIGSAVIAGHYGWENGRGSVFNELHTLKIGDTIAVSDDKGAVVSFIVRESRSYDPAADATNIFRSNDGKAHLNLITCEGKWDNARQTYSSRLVVFTDKK